ncbi:MAG: non-homologous end-joining DNA ligase [Acidimicrobiales bacterium]
MVVKPSHPPGSIAPMKAVLGDLPTGEGWAYELKWDGMRIVARCDPTAGPRLWSANGREVTPSYPELAGLGPLVGVPAVLDGEVVVLDDDGQPSFGRLQNRMHVTAPSAALMGRHPVVYLVFDLLELDGRPLVDLPYTTRRRLLRKLIDDGPVVRVPPSIEGGGRGEGAALLDLARQRGLEGVVAKRLDSRYMPGGRTREWIKVKVRLHQELVVGGWLPGQGALAGRIGSLLVGYHEPGTGDARRLRFAGAVGSGLTDKHRELLRPRLRPRPTSPFVEVPPLLKPPSWVEPDVVVEVSYGSWADDGLLRHPVFLGIRDDKEPSEVIRELPTRPPNVG